MIQISIPTTVRVFFMKFYATVTVVSDYTDGEMEPDGIDADEPIGDEIAGSSGEWCTPAT